VATYDLEAADRTSNAEPEPPKVAVTQQEWEETTQGMRQASHNLYAHLYAHLRAMTEQIDVLEGQLTTAPQRKALDATRSHLAKITLELVLNPSDPRSSGDSAPGKG
jgi:hypothetical protein